MPSAFSIRPAHRDDVPALVQLIGQLAAHHSDTPTTNATLLERDAFGADPWIEILVAQSSERLIGYTVLCPLYRAQLGQRGLNMHHLLVVEDWRSKGVGRALIEAMLARARELDCTYVKVGTHPDNEAARRFYLAYGFEPAAPGPQFRFNLTAPARSDK